MSPIFAAILGAIQGFSEFLPISSDGHLSVAQILLAPVFGALQSPLAFDVLLHGGTLLAVMIALRTDVVFLLRSLFLQGEAGARARWIAFLLIVATIPAGIIGLTLKDAVEASYSSLALAGAGFLLTSAFVEVAHRSQVKRGMPSAAMTDLSWELPTLTQAVLIGVAQSLAILPGVSRSGSTIALAIVMGIAPLSAVRFSFLMSIPVILGAIVLNAKDIADLSELGGGPMAVGFFTALGCGLIAIPMVSLVVSKLRLRVFSIYTAILGIVVLAVSTTL